MEILQKAEDRGYVHQITNIDGENEIFGICSCAVGVCNALRTSQLFNTPNLSASAYVAESDLDKCVACGKCVETCPAALSASARSSAPGRPHPVSAPRAAGRHQVGRGSLE
ncbi:MAG: 4Fe-4S binding protein [Oscillospiraceae bacterium]